MKPIAQIICGIVLAAMVSIAAVPSFAAESAPRSGPALANILTNASLDEIEYPQAVFLSRPDTGLDPFFPESTRRMDVVALRKRAVEEAKKPTRTPAAEKILAGPPVVARPLPVEGPKVLKYLSIKGVSGTSKRRFVTLHTTTKSYHFKTGDEMLIRIPDGKLQVRCLEIRGSSAVFQVKDHPESIELFLRNKF
ncbi:MAG: hypothetical protein ACI9OD_001293 [Limisphaerales bacterium]|jgi:hypothetical protein